MRTAYEKYEEEGFAVISVSVQETKDVVTEFIDKHDLTYPFALDREGTTAQRYGVYVTPTTYFIAPDGTIASFLPGIVNEYWLENNLQATTG